MRGPLSGPPLQRSLILMIFLITKLVNAQDAFTTLAPTYPPAPFNAVFCRGGACHYRVPPIIPPLPTVPPINPLFDLLRNREFCRGKACIGAPVGVMGWPVSGEADAFALNCSHLFNDVAGGLKGEDGKRTLMDVHDSFMAWCVKRVDLLEVGACGAYADVMTMALSPNVNAPSQGGVADICTFLFLFIESVKSAEVDLKLIPEAIPSSSSLLAKAVSRLGGKGGGPTSPRGKKWIQYLEEHKQNLNFRQFSAYANFYAPPSCSASPAAKVMTQDWIPSTVQRRAKERQNLLQAASFLQESVEPTAMSDVAQPICFQDLKTGDKHYELVPGSPDGLVPPVNMDGKLFEFCMAQFHEIQAGLPQTGNTVNTLTKDWCGWQSTVALFVGDETSARADWTFRTCNNMYKFVSYALRTELEKGLWPSQVCKLLFLQKGPVHRVAELVRDAWIVSVRGSAQLALASAVDDKAMARLMQNAQEIADTTYKKLRKQRTDLTSMLATKREAAAMEAWEHGGFELTPPMPPPPPPLPPPSSSQSLFMAP